MQGAQAAGERVLSLLATIPSISDSDEVKAKLEKWGDLQDRPEDLAIDGEELEIKTLEFRDVDFSYTDGETILKGFNLTVRSGETIAFVGASGGGKSTIVNLAARFYEPTGGGILVNGKDLRERSLAWYQSNLGIVLQGPHLFSGSVRENIRYGRLEATDQEVEAAAQQANADQFICNLEEGYETDVGEGGNRLSTGQKQLISFARALLAEPSIFIMDEATSSIDTETEQLIQEGMQTIFEGRISFVIVHRLSTIRTADRICVIENGGIMESGSHEELIALEGHYKALYNHQFNEQIKTELLRGEM
jgi:ATP-binding cassette subfamily B protein